MRANEISFESAENTILFDFWIITCNAAHSSHITEGDDLLRLGTRSADIPALVMDRANVDVSCSLFAIQAQEQVSK